MIKLKSIHRIPLLILIIIVIITNQLYGKGSLRDHEDQITKNFNVKSGQLLYLKTDIGSVGIDSWNRDEVEIIVTKKSGIFNKQDAEDMFDKFELSFDQTSRGIDVRGEYLGSKGWFHSYKRLNVHFDIKVPYEFDLDINTAGGSIDVSDIKGDVSLHTSGGSINVGAVAGPLNANTSGGSITVKQADGDVDVKTSGGSIYVGEITGSLDAKTSGGGISLDGVAGDTYAHTSGGSLKLKNLRGNVDASTSGGGIYAEVIGKIDKDCSLKSSGGGITLYLSRDVSAEIDAHTSGGHVSTDFLITVRGKINSNSLRGKINDGGPLITLRTSGGGISINER